MKIKKTKPSQQKKPLRGSENTPNKWLWFALAIVFLSTFAIYFQALNFDLLFSWDDNVYISNNVALKDLHWANIKQFFTEFYAGNYQPITMLMYAIEYKVVANSPMLYHFNNILLHILNTGLVFILIRKISPKNDIAALVTAAFFAIHPMHVESVAWVAERKDVLYSFFFLISLIFYTNYLQSKKTHLLFFSGAFFVLSCFSKSAAVVLPLVMLFGNLNIPDQMSLN